MILKFAMDVDRFKRAVLLTDKKVNARMVAAIAKGTRTVTQGAIARAPVKSGELRSSIRDEYSKTGLTGYVKAGYGKLQRRSAATTVAGMARAKARAESRRKAKTSKQALNSIELAVYAPVVERGDKRRNMTAQPFLHPSFRAARPGIQTDVGRAMEVGLTDGMRSS